MKKLTFLFLTLSICLFLGTTSCNSKTEEATKEKTEEGNNADTESNDSESENDDGNTNDEDATTTENSDDYLGVWKYFVKGTPLGDVEGTLNFAKTTDGYSATISSSEGTGPINDFRLRGNKFSGMFNMSDGTAVDVSGSLKGDAMIGEVGAQGFTFKMEGERSTSE